VVEMCLVRRCIRTPKTRHPRLTTFCGTLRPQVGTVLSSLFSEAGDPPLRCALSIVGMDAPTRQYYDAARYASSSSQPPQQPAAD
jgi:hypothetical protein